MSITLDYAAFRNAYGGDFAGRLKLVRLPACALAVPVSPSCRTAGEPVRVNNDTRGGRIGATVPAVPAGQDGEVLLLKSSVAGESGSYAATDTKSSGEWDVSLASGAFTYSYAFQLPPPPYGSAPTLGLAYNSQSVDGRTSAENNQASVAGLGWDLQTGSIERKFKPCSEDANNDTMKAWGDLCWDSPYKGKDDGALYTISLNGQTTELIWDGDHYRMKDDQNWRIEHPTTGGQGADSEYWIITTPDGTRYYLGYGADPTKTTGNATNSVWTVPVIGDDVGEPCHTSTDPAQMQPCQQAYRWNLDRVVDSDENETVFSYAAESNAYKRVQGAKTVSYTRGGYLSRVEYGKRSDQPKDTPAPNVVELSHLARCLEATGQSDPYSTQPASCPAITPANAGSYKDVPVDKICSANCTETTPSFFITNRLHRVVTKVRKIDGSAGYDDVNTYQLKMAFPDVGDADTSGALWLDYVRRIGHMGEGPDVKLPPVSFDGGLLANRADGGGGLLKMRRVVGVNNDLGGGTTVTYGQPDNCNTGLTDWSGEKNLKDCFRQFYTPDGQTAGKWGVFNKYLVTQAVDTDRVGGQPDQTTKYEYSGGAGWRFDDDLSRKTDNQSWSDYRGYASVKVTKGASADRTKLTVSTHTFFRGLHNDRTKQDGTGTNRTVALTDFDGKVWEDFHFLTGRPLQTRTWQETTVGDAFDVSSTRHTYWRSARTADGPGFHNAYMIRPDSAVTRARKADGTYRLTGTDTSFDDEGRPVKTLDKGDPADSADDRCAATTYADNSADGRWMLAFPESLTVHEGACDGPVAAKTVTLYDGAEEPGAGNKPVDGNATSVRTYQDADSYTAAAMTYDRFGRVTATTTPNGTTATNDDTTTIGYGPVEGWPTNGVTTTTPPPTPGGQPHVSKVFPGRADGATAKTLDPNNNVTSLDYDRAGRLIRVWGPTEPKPTNPSESRPTMQYSYWTTQEGIGPPSKATVVKTDKLQSGSASNPDWMETWGYLDGFGRQIESQTRTPAGAETGRMISITRYDDRGLVAGTTGTPIYNADAPGRGLVNTDWTGIPSWTVNSYDGAERPMATTLYGAGTKKWAATVASSADITVATPPSGGKRAVFTDSRGRTSSLVEDYQGQKPATTRYGYTVRDELASVTDAEGNIIRQQYNWSGQVVSGDDPDAGHSTSTYDAAGNLVSSTDGVGAKVSSTYDALNRRTGEWAGEPDTGTRLAQWEYDPSGFKGQLAAATRWTGGQAYRTEVLAYDDRYRPLGKRVTIPGSEGALAGRYEYQYRYDKADHLTELTMPAAGGLPAEKLTATYSPLTGTARTLTSDFGDDGYTYVKQNHYWSTGEIAQRDYGKLGGIARSYDFDDPTGRITRARTVTGNDTGERKPLQDDAYGYTAAGMVSQITETLTESADGAQGPQRQCFTYDGANRLAQAWTTTSTTARDCTGGIDGADGRGPDPYKLGHEYTDSGNISSVTDSGAKRTYTYPAAGPDAVRPHSVTSITGSAGSDSYGYDDAGRMTTRTVGGKTTTLDWDQTHRLALATTGGSKTGMVYDAEGARLIRRDGATTTLYLDGMELRATGTSVSATRYYSLNGATVALRKNGDPAATWMMGDTQGSAQLTVEGWTGNLSRQRYLPFGAHRGGRDDITATERGFLGKTEDPTTGLVALDNRFYDAAIGRFINPDPLANPGSPQSLNPYSYAQNNPTSDSDPSGLCSPMAGCATNPGLANGAGGGEPDTSSGGTTEGCGAQAYMTGDRSCGGGGLGTVISQPQYAPRAARPPSPSGKEVLLNSAGFTFGLMSWMPVLDGIGDAGSAAILAIQGKWGEAGLTAAMIFLPVPSGGPIGRQLLRKLGFLPGGSSKPRVPGTGGSGKPDGTSPQKKTAGSQGKQQKRSGGDGNAPVGAPRGKTSACEDNSFVPATEVAMADGTREPIENIKVGDRVLATDPATGKTRAQPVTAVIAGKGTKNLVQITVDTDGPTGHKTGAVIATDNHPFWIADQHRWMNAGELKPGMWLRTSAGTHTQITALQTRTATHQPVHNLTTNDTHTYNVLAGETPVLVHNSGGCPTAGLLSPSHQAIGASNARGGIYALVSENETVMRTGMATDLQSRLATHRRDYPGLTGVVLYRTDNRAARRGLEEMIENWYTPILANQRAIRLDNPRRQEYLQTARNFLDQWG